MSLLRNQLQIREDTYDKHYTTSRIIKRTLQGSIILSKSRNHNNNEQQYACKTSSLSLVNKSTNRQGQYVMEDIFNELDLLQRVEEYGSHPNIIQLYDSFVDDTRIYMILEICSKGELYELIESQGALGDTVQCKLIFQQICNAIQHLHNVLRIVHLDISLENVFINEQGFCKLGDFGLAKEFNNSNSNNNNDDDKFDIIDNHRPGKLQYMAPEIVEYSSFHGKKADIFALGVLLFTIVFGFPPFDEACSSDRRYQLIKQHELHVLLGKWGIEAKDDLVDLLQGMLLPEEDRITIDQVVQHAWLQ